MGLIASEAVPQQATKSNTQINSFTVRHIIGPKALAACACVVTVSLRLCECFLALYVYVYHVCVFYIYIYIYACMCVCVCGCAHVHTCTLMALGGSSSGLSLERLCCMGSPVLLTADSLVGLL